MGARSIRSPRAFFKTDHRKARPNPRGIAAPAPRIRLDRATSACLAHAVSITGIPTAELIDTALQHLLSGSFVDSLAHSGGGYPQSLPDRGAFTRIGWLQEGIPMVPTVADLLPQDMQGRFLEVWLTTGANVLHSNAVSLLATLGDAGPEAVRLVTDAMEAEIHDRVDGFRARWEGGLSK
ncbi:MAG: hypothetical protein JWM59_2937 [Verrucomicrobiales bacterium]|nr:hypothetical protein [Verrucomicrobiales bacterium]